MPLSKKVHRELVARIQQLFAGHEDAWREQLRKWGREEADQPIGDHVLPANPSVCRCFALLAAINDKLIVHDASVVRIEPWPEIPFHEGIVESTDAALPSEQVGEPDATMVAVANFGMLRFRLDDLSDTDEPLLSRFLQLVDQRLNGSDGVEQVPGAASNHHAAAKAETAASTPLTKAKRSTVRGEATAKILGALMVHHKYESGTCDNRVAPISCSELARQAGVAKSSVSRFFERSRFKNHQGYVTACNKQGVHHTLAILSGDCDGHRLQTLDEEAIGARRTGRRSLKRAEY